MPAFLRLSFSTKVAFSLFIGLSIVLALGAFGLYSVGEFFDTGIEVRRLLQVRGMLEVVQRDIERAESMQLRYQLVADPAVPGKFGELTARVFSEIDSLYSTVIAADQRARLVQLKRDLQIRFDVLREAMLRRDSGGTGVALLLSEHSVLSREEVRQVFTAIGERQQRIARERAERVESLVGLLVKLAFGGGGIAVALLLWTISVINRYERDRERSESELAYAQERLAFALEGSNSAAWDWDLVRNEVYLSSSWQQMLGGEARETTVTPAALLALVHPEDVDQVQSATKDALAGTAADYRAEHRVRRTSGDWIWVLSRGRVMRRDDKGKAMRITGTNQDVTQRKAMELALSASEAELRLITDSVPAFIGYADTSETLLFCNKALATFVGAQPKDVVGRPLRELYGEAVYRVIQPYAQRALAGERVQFQRQQTTRDGRVIDLDIIYVPRRGTLGEVEGFYSLSTDITELRRLDRMKSEFVSTVSHELRTPLTSIRGSLGILAGGVAGPLSDKVRGFIDIAKENCERLIRLINDILDMEKIESGKMTFQLQVLDLMELIERLVRANDGFAMQHDVRLQIVSAQPGAKVHADSDRLAQVLTNLISNACKFSPAQASVDIAVSAAGERIRVDVVDRGPGISEAFRRRIFQKFSQEDSTDMRQKGGTGLGLSISKAIVEGFGGEIGFDTEAGKGSTFYFYLPRWREPGAVAASSARQ